MLPPIDYAQLAAVRSLYLSPTARRYAVYAYRAATPAQSRISDRDLDL